MDNELSKDTEEFLVKLVRLSGTMKELFSSGNIELFPGRNDAIKKRHALQHGSRAAGLGGVWP